MTPRGPAVRRSPAGCPPRRSRAPAAGGLVRPSQVRTSRPSSPAFAASSTYATASGNRPAQRGQVLEAVARGLAVDRAQQRELGVFAVAGERAVRQRRVQIAVVARHLHQAGVAGDRGEHPGLHLVGVGDHQAPALVGDDRLPYHLGDLQCATAVGRPAAGDRAARQVLGAEAAVAHPVLEPAPAVGASRSGTASCTRSAGSTAGWSSSASSQRRVDLTLMPAAPNAFTTSAGRSGRTRRLPKAADTWSASSARRRGRNRPGLAARAEQAGRARRRARQPATACRGRSISRRGQAARGLHGGQQPTGARVSAAIRRNRPACMPTSIWRTSRASATPSSAGPNRVACPVAVARRARAGKARAGKARAGGARAGMTRGVRPGALAGMQQGLGEGDVVATAHLGPRRAAGTGRSRTRQPRPSAHVRHRAGRARDRHRRREIVDQGQARRSRCRPRRVPAGCAVRPGPAATATRTPQILRRAGRQSCAPGRECSGVWSRPGPWAGRAGPRRLDPQPEGCPWCPPAGPENLAGCHSSRQSRRP